MLTHDNVGKMEAQLAQWGARIDDLVVKAADTSAEAKVDYHKRVDALKVKVHHARTKLDEVKAAGSENWDTIVTGLESAWKEVGIAFDKLKD